MTEEMGALGCWIEKLSAEARRTTASGDRLASGLLPISIWPVERRIVWSLSPRVDYLMAAIRSGERIRDLSDANAESRRPLWRFAANILNVAGSFRTMNPDEIVNAARATDRYLPVQNSAYRQQV